MKAIQQSILGIVVISAGFFSSAFAAGNPIKQLEATVDALTVRLAALETEVQSGAALQTRVTELETANAALQERLACVSSTSSSWDLFLEGCNVHVRDGTGGSDSTSGFGNLLIGYDEGTGGKNGTHNLVVGPGHTYTSWGGVLFGHSNAVTAPAAAVLAGNGVRVNEEGAWAAGTVAENGAEELTMELQQFTVKAKEAISMDAPEIESTALLKQTLKSGGAMDLLSTGNLEVKSATTMTVSGVASTRVTSDGATRIDGSLVQLNDGGRPAAGTGDPVLVAPTAPHTPTTGQITGGSPTVLLP